MHGVALEAAVRIASFSFVSQLRLKNRTYRTLKLKIKRVSDFLGASLDRIKRKNYIESFFPYKVRLRNRFEVYLHFRKRLNNLEMVFLTLVLIWLKKLKAKYVNSVDLVTLT